MKNLIIVYSGNGNSKYVADQLDIKDKEIHFVHEYLKGKRTIGPEVERIGLVMPVYHNGVPYPMVEFIKNVLSRRDNINLEYLYAIMTYSDQLGFALQSLDRLLMEQGVNLAYAASIKMPETNLRKDSHPLSEMKTLAFAIKEVNNLKKISQEIETSQIKIVHNHFFGLISDKISRKKNMPHSFKEFHVNGKCNGCEICLKICPMNNIKMHNSKPVLLASCIECFACYNRCPQNALMFKNTEGQYKGLVDTKELIKR